MSHSASLSLVSVQIAQARKVMISGRSILTAIHKTAALGPVPVGVLGLEGDEQADLSVHGGLDKAFIVPITCISQGLQSNAA
jgi:MOSC domain-containing protein YiiM